MLWMHGRTVSKELDPGRYLRWVRAGIAAVALDLPGHGQRSLDGWQGSERTLEAVQQMASEIDAVLSALAATTLSHGLDLSRCGIGGMSAGGMATLIRLCTPHRFRVASVESTAGDFQRMAASTAFATRGGRDPSMSLLQQLDPMSHLQHWRPIPLLALHSEADAWVPVQAMRGFIEELQRRGVAAGLSPEHILLHTWPTTGAPNEHAGFGKVSHEAKNIQTDFLVRHLGAS
jgi:dienelactone hydrolase